METAEKAIALRDALVAITPERSPLVLSRGTGAEKIDLVFDRKPELVYSGDTPVGVDALIRAFGGTAATELQIDPHRRFVNPPTMVEDGGSKPAVGLLGQRYSVPTFKSDPAAAFEEILRQSIQRAPAPKGFRTLGTVTTIFGDTADDWQQSANAVYATALAGPGGGAVNDGRLVFGQYLSGGVYVILQAFIGFDTSVLSGQRITDAAVSLYGKADASTTNFNMIVRILDWGTAVTAADWTTGFDLSAGVLGTAGFTIAGYNDFPSTAAGIASVNPSGFTRFLVVNNKIVTATAPTNFEYVEVWDAEDAGTTRDPKLTVTHELRAGRMTLLGAM